MALFDERFKTKTGFQKSFDLTQQQVDQLINGQDVTLAYQSGGRRPVFLASSLLLSAGLGTVTMPVGIKAPANVIFTLGRFQSTLNVSSRIVGVARSYGRLGHYFIDPTATTRQTANTQGSQIFVSSYNSTGSLGGYSYTYPLPPSPAPVFDAPVWYWHQYTRPSTGQTFSVFPPNVSTSGFDITNFSSSPVSLTNRVNATIAGSTVDLVYTTAAPYGAEIGLSDLIDVSNGFESTYDFSITKSSIIDNKDYQSINLKIESPDRSYTDFGIELYGNVTVGLIGWLGTKTINKTVPSVSDGKVHRIKVIIRNTGANTIGQIFWMI